VRFLLAEGAKAGGKRALAFSLMDESREPVAKQLRAAGFKADEETVRMVAEFSNAEKQQGQQTQTAQASTSNQSQQAGSDIAEAAADVAITGVLWSVLGF